jgi:hypothetical protein
MITEIYIRQANKQAHYDLQKDIMEQKNGVFTFILKVSGGNICDYVRLQTKRFTDYSQK